MRTTDLTQTATKLAAAVIEITKAYRTDGRWYEAVGMLESALKVDEMSAHDRARLQSALAAYLLKHADYNRVEQLLSEAHENVKSVADPALEADILYSLGELAYFRTMLQDGGTYATAHEFHQQSLDIRERTKDDIGKIDSWSRIGILYEREGDDKTARGYYEQSIALCEKIGYLRGMARPYTHIGAFYHRNGDLATALEYYEKALAVGQEGGDADNWMFANMNVGYAIFRLRGDVETTLPYLHRACEIAEKIGHKMAICVVHMRLGIAYAAANNLPTAQHHYQIMADVAEKHGFDSFRELAKTELEALQTT